MHKTLIHSLTILLLSFSVSNAQIIIEYDSLHVMKKIGTSVEYLEDQNGELNIEDILKPEYQNKFQRQNKEIFNRSATKSVFWFKISLQNQSNQDLWLEIGEANYTWYADFYAPDQQNNYNKPRLLGSLRPQKNKEFPTNSYCVFLSPKEDQELRTYYLRLEEKFAYTHMFSVGTQLALFKHRKSFDYTFGIFLGLIVGMIIYNLFILLSTRERVYFFYFLYLIWAMFAVPFNNGYFLVYHPWFWEYFLVWIGMGLLFTTLFATNYFDKYLYQVKLLVYWLWGLTIFQSIILPLLNIFQWGVFQDLINMSSLAVVLHNLTLLLLSVLIWLKGFRQARFYVFARFFVILATIVFLFSVNGLMPINHFTQNALYYGFSAEILLFALALGDRLNVLKKENELTQGENLRIIQEQNEILEEKVLIRTKELQESNEEMQVMNEELLQTQEELHAQRDSLDERNQQLDRANQKNQNNLQVLHKQNQKLNVQNKKINSSMKAAETIQLAILPQAIKFQELFQECFVINRPRDVVSGDFYWLKKVKDKIIMVVADCTGHGVPGAFMTLIGINLLDKIVEELRVYQPADILNQLHLEIQNLLKQKKTNNNNGMDAVVITLEDDQDQKILTFAGAKNNIYYCSEGQLQELKGTRKSIGGIQNESIQFEEEKVSIHKGEMIYLGSDGLEDQNNKKRKKFGKKRLKQLLSQISSLSISQQKLKVQEALYEHKQGTEQRDDILWMGIRV